ncbi:MAG: C4-dicarboxylate ABC transporter [Armatimonadota bacterium]|nr:C4-dicarboxylate ABC transporter [Armatimonadota bacterium]
MYAHAGIVLAVMVAVFLLARRVRVTIELAMFAAAVAGLLAHGTGYAEIPRHLVDGAFTYFDVTLIFITATLFMNLLKEAGGVAYIIRAILRRFHRQRTLTLVLLTLILLVPGALTGAGSVTVLIVGGLVGTVLTYMGVPQTNVVAIVFLCAAMSAAAPPVNLWAMMTAAGSNMPYVGFFLPLAVITLAGALFSMFYLGWRGSPPDLARVMRELPEPPPGLTGWKVAAPFVVLLALIAAGRLWPWAVPVLGLPLLFMISAAMVLLISPIRLPVVAVTSRTIEGLLPLIGVMIVVGILVQSMALTGARGLISLSVVLLPLAVIYGLLFLILPFSEGLLQYAVGPLLGVPLILLFNMKGLNPIIALAGMATMWPIGDMLPPTTVVGRAAVMVLRYEGAYYREFVRATLVPALVILALGTAYVVFSRQLAFLVW